MVPAVHADGRALRELFCPVVTDEHATSRMHLARRESLAPKPGGKSSSFGIIRGNSTTTSCCLFRADQPHTPPSSSIPSLALPSAAVCKELLAGSKGTHDIMLRCLFSVCVFEHGKEHVKTVVCDIAAAAAWCGKLRPEAVGVGLNEEQQTRYICQSWGVHQAIADLGIPSLRGPTTSRGGRDSGVFRTVRSIVQDTRRRGSRP